ncbi:hypothetical protein D3C72_2021180 [compost metagenome]
MRFSVFAISVTEEPPTYRRTTSTSRRDRRLRLPSGSMTWPSLSPVARNDGDRYVAPA